jgi:AraC-like DNA-binding protein
MDTPPRAGLLDYTSRIPLGALVQDEFNIDSPWHTHDVHQLQYAAEGAMEIEDAHHRALLPRQLAAWVPAGILHRTSLHRVRSVSVMLPRSSVPHCGDRVRVIVAPPLLRELIFEATRWPIHRELDSNGRLFFAAFAMLLAGWLEREAPLILPTSTDGRVNAAMEYTRANLASATIGDAAEIASMSVRTLRRRFQAAGVGWEAYRRRACLLSAIGLLDETDLSIGEIAGRVGYDSQSAFSKAFSDLLRTTPTEFRRRARR